MKLNAYCIECLTRTKQHCEGRSDEAVNNHANDVRLTFADGSYEPRPDYVQTVAGSDSSGRNRLHGLNFCPSYQLDPAQLPRMKSAQAIRNEFNAQRAANKAVTKAEKDAAKAEKLAEKKQKAKIKAEQKVDKKAANAIKQKIVDGQRAAEQATQSAMQPETLNQAVNNVMPNDEDDFSDLII